MNGEEEIEKLILEVANGNVNDYSYLLGRRLFLSKDPAVRAAALAELSRLIEFEERP